MNSMLLVMMVMMAVVSQAQVKVITFNQLPKAAQNFVNKHYDSNMVSYIYVESEFMSAKEYEVRLNDGKKIEFNAKGAWTEVDAKHKSVPQDIIPASINTYVNKSFPNNAIVQIAKSSRKYEIELSNGLDLEFDSKGRFVRIDD